MSELTATLAASRCPSCGTELAATLLACPACHSLVHRARLESLAAEADGAGAQKDYARAIALWREAFALVPSGSRQHEAIARRIEAMTAAQSRT